MQEFGRAPKRRLASVDRSVNDLAPRRRCVARLSLLWSSVLTVCAAPAAAAAPPRPARRSGCRTGLCGPHWSLMDYLSHYITALQVDESNAEGQRMERD